MNIVDKILIVLVKRQIKKSIKLEQKLIAKTQKIFGKNYYGQIDMINLNNQIINENRISNDYKCFDY